MSITFGIEVEHVHYALLLNTEKQNQGTIDLTTLADNQKKALIRVFLFEKHTKTLIHTIELAPLPRKPAGNLRISCRGEFKANRYLHLSVSLEGKNLYSKAVDVKKHRKGGPGRWLIPLLIVLIGGGITAALLLARADKGHETVQKGLLDTKTEREAAGPRPAAAEAGGAAEESTTAEETASAGDGFDAAAKDTAKDIGEDAAAAAETTSAAAEKTAAAAESAAAEEKEDGPEPAPAVTVSRETVYFLPESSVLLEPAKTALRQIYDRVAGTDAFITAIEGHCALFDTEESREWLSEERAENVYAYLRQLGAPFSAPPEVRGVGGRKPVTRALDKQELNRRVEILIETTVRRDAER